MRCSGAMGTVFLLCCMAWLPAQTAPQSSTPAETTPVFRIDVNRVLVPVVVRDKHGTALAGLKKEDFRVYDNDKPREISGFVVESHTNLQTLAEPAANPPEAKGDTPQKQATQRFVLLLFDDMHLDFGDLAQAQSAGAKAIDAVAAGSYALGVFSTSFKVRTEFMRDRALLRKAVMSVRPETLYRSSTADCPYISYYQADLMENHRDAQAIAEATRQVFNCDPSLDRQRDQNLAERIAQSAAMQALNLGNQDIRATYAAIAAYVRAMAKLPGERTLILVSPGFQPIEEVARAEESRLMDLAAQSNVTISTLDARGVYTSEITASMGRQESSPYQSDIRRTSMQLGEEALGELADGTGGIFYHGSNDLETGFKALANGPEVVYVLELPLSDVKPDGSFHRLKVKVNRGGMDVQARRGYFVPKAARRKK